MKSSPRSGAGKAFWRAALVLLVLSAGAAVFPITALQTRPQALGYMQGTVTSSKGPEAGVWVIAETKDLPTGMIKIVVTDDRGRYVLPEMPAANYRVWVRGYGLADSKPVTAKPSTANNAPALNLTAILAKDDLEAAKVYPGDYWMQMMSPPKKSDFPLGGSTQMTQATVEGWLYSFKSSCNFCHQLGTPIVRDMEHVFKAKPELKTSMEAWDYRLQAGVRGSSMYGAAKSLNLPFALKMFSDWTDRIAKGETPKIKPPRPAGIERNVVITLWDWGTDHSFMHDQLSTSKQDPTIGGGGRTWAVSAGHGTLVWLDPKTSETGEIEIPTREVRSKVPSRFPPPNPPSLWWGDARLWNGPEYSPSDPHNLMIDNKSRIWLASKIRGEQQPAWCSDPAANKSAAYYPLRSSGRQASFYDPKTQKFHLIETCYATHHIQFDNDPNQTAYFNELSGPIFGWIDSKVYDETLARTKDEFQAEKAAVGWCPQVLDTNGDGKITKPWQVAPRNGFDNLLYVTDTAGGNTAAATPLDKLDPTKDTVVNYSLYSDMPSPVDDTVWGVSEVFPGYLVQLKRGNNPPESCLTRIFKVPSPGLDPRGVDVDTNGVVWTALAASSHLASFDVRKCKNLNDPKKQMDGSLCPEGWKMFQTNGPRFENSDLPTDFHYFNWVDQFGASGFPKNTPMANGSNSDSILVLDSQQGAGHWVTLRVPYPLGFYSRGMDARVDDPKATAGFAGWKSRALWSNYGTHFVWHTEGGKGTKGKEVKFQIRPNPLAR